MDIIYLFAIGLGGILCCAAIIAFTEFDEFGKSLFLMFSGLAVIIVCFVMIGQNDFESYKQQCEQSNGELIKSFSDNGLECWDVLNSKRIILEREKYD